MVTQSPIHSISKIKFLNQFNFQTIKKMLHRVSLLLLVSTSIMAEEEKERAECIMWSHLENKTMPLQDQGRYERNVNYMISYWSMVIKSLL